jgi:hypothetical protein
MIKKLILSVATILALTIAFAVTAMACEGKDCTHEGASITVSDLQSSNITELVVMLAEQTIAENWGAVASIRARLALLGVNPTVLVGEEAAMYVAMHYPQMSRQSMQRGKDMLMSGSNATPCFHVSGVEEFNRVSVVGSVDVCRRFERRIYIYCIRCQITLSVIPWFEVGTSSHSWRFLGYGDVLRITRLYNCSISGCPQRRTTNSLLP